MKMDLRKIDALIADKKGYRFFDHDKYYEQPNGLILAGHPRPSYTTNGCLMVELMEELKGDQKYGNFSIGVRIDGQWYAGYEKEDQWGEEIDGEYTIGVTPQLAVALLWCKVHDVNVEGINNGCA